MKWLGMRQPAAWHNGWRISDRHILQQTLNEEGEANKKLASLAESHGNVAATLKA
jgi:hypothetical protein